MVRESGKKPVGYPENTRHEQSLASPPAGRIVGPAGTRLNELSLHTKGRQQDRSNRRIAGKH